MRQGGIHTTMKLLAQTTDVLRATPLALCEVLKTSLGKAQARQEYETPYAKMYKSAEGQFGVKDTMGARVYVQAMATHAHPAAGYAGQS